LLVRTDEQRQKRFADSDAGTKQENLASVIKNVRRMWVWSWSGRGAKQIGAKLSPVKIEEQW